MYKAKLIVPLALLALAANLPADTIFLITGETHRNVTVRSFNVNEIRFMDEGRRERTIPTWRVAQVRAEGANLPRLYTQGLNALADGDIGKASDLLRNFAERTAVTSTHAWMRQLALWNLAQAMLRSGSPELHMSGLSEINELVQLIPDTAFLPDFYRLRLAGFFGANDEESIRNARRLIENWIAQIQKDKFSDAYLHEAMVDQVILGRDYGKKPLNPEEAYKRLKEIAQAVGDKAPLAVSRAKVEMGWSLLHAQKFQEARPYFLEVKDGGFALDMTLARAWLGYGHTYGLQQPISPESAKSALMAYMRVPVNFKSIADDFGRGAEQVAQAIYYAERAYRAWAGPGWNDAVARLRSVRRSTYRATYWGRLD